jgi:DNA polymerase I-like protein with 3'-5' exonuclease and polymerase domains
LYPGIKLFEQKLLRQHTENDGWILNGVNRPLGVDGEKTKDIVNRFVQSTGHDMLWVFIEMVCQQLKQQGTPWQPFIIDYHDETMIEVEEANVEAAKEAFRISTVNFNKMLGWDIYFDGDIDVGDTLADIKQPERESAWN